MDWRDRVRGKLVTPQQAVTQVKSGNAVALAPYSSTPHTLCGALHEYAKTGAIERVRIDHPASGAPWTEPWMKGVFELHDNYATPANRAACHAGEMEYLPVGIWKSHELPPGLVADPDVFMVPVSPPNERGFSSFGSGVWFSGTLAKRAKLVIAEVQPDFIRTGGENYIHADEIDLYCEGTIPTGSLPVPPLRAEEVEAVEVICTLVASELIHDGNTLQMGVGTVSAALAPYLERKNDLGIQTELITGGIADLVKRGVVTGARKSWHRFKVVGSALVALSREELLAIHEHPAFELYDFGYTDDLRQLIQQENFVAVNNALIVDLTGQVSAESLDHRMYTGVGGQTVFMIAGAYSPGGKSISVLPSSSVPSGSNTRVSRIVPVLGPGAAVTVPRTYVDNVVTEHGIAELRGKTLKQRARALVEISHPDFRPELARRARELYGVA